jgi:hypothetical protein
MSTMWWSRFDKGETEAIRRIAGVYYLPHYVGYVFTDDIFDIVKFA